MLILTRKLGEGIIMGEHTKVTVDAFVTFRRTIGGVSSLLEIEIEERDTTQRIILEMRRPYDYKGVIIQYLARKGNAARIGINAPPNIPILREELLNEFRGGYR